MKEQTKERSGTDGQDYNAGRLEGHADVCAELRAIVDPEDEQHWNKDGLLNEVRRLKEVRGAWLKQRGLRAELTTAPDMQNTASCWDTDDYCKGWEYAIYHVLGVLERRGLLPKEVDDE